VRILVTGHRGHVGAAVTAHLERLGHSTVGFDRADGDDLRDFDAVRRATDGCEAVVHAGAIPHDNMGSPQDIMAVNVQGTWHVLLAAEAAGARRVVYFSSIQVFGTAEGERLPDYFPVDDAHPRRATRPYGLSKALAEDLCAGFTARTGIPTVALRPSWVWSPRWYAAIEERWRADPAAEWSPTWEWGQFIDVRDVAAAVRLSLEQPLSGHHRALLCAADIAASEPALAMAARFAPSVPVRDRARFEREPWRAVFDHSAATRLLGWEPRRTWAARGQDQPD
jgi:nucleoside-diphosphate-sugar epimerase